MHISAALDQVGKWVVVSSKLQLDLVRHGQDEVFEFGEAELIEIECEW